MPRSGFTGADSFTYRANDGGLNSSLTTVSITVNSANPLFSENFTRGADPAPISPWTDMEGTGASMQTRAAVDPMVQKEGLGQMAGTYLQGADPPRDEHRVLGTEIKD